MRYLVPLLLCTFCLPFVGMAAEMNAQERVIVKKIGDLIRQAGVQYQASDFESAGQTVELTIDSIEKAMGEASPEFFDAIAPSFSRITKAQAMLELEGISTRPFTAPERPAAKPKAPAAVRPPRATTKKPTPDDPKMDPAPSNPLASAIEPISFVKTVAPILVQRCGQCHVTGNRGDFSMATFAMLEKGPPEGRVIFAGDVIASRLIETIETGDMPRGGGKVPAAELRTLKDWIAGGAKYDGPTPDAPLSSFVSSQAPAETPAMPAPVVKRASGNETVSFSKDVAPILLKNCNGCHIDAMQVRGGLRMDTFASLLRGGDSGAIVDGGKSATSLLVRKLKGEEGDRMPAGGRPPLSEEQITLISRWIDEGAPLDGASEDQPLGVMASLAWVKTATDEELSERRQRQAQDNLTLVTGAPPKSAGETSEHFLVVGDIGSGTSKAVVDAAELAWKEIAPFVVQDTVRGRITLFVMPRRYDYSEFAKMVEQRSVPSDWQSHWSHDGIDAYVAMVVSSEDEEDVIKARLIGPLASLVVAMRGGGVPRWFAEGIGRATAAKLAGRELPAVDAWNRDLPSAVSIMKDGQQFVKNELTPEQSDVIAYGLATAMLSRNQRRQYDALIRSLPAAASFDAAFEQAFGVPPADFITQFKQYAATGVQGRSR